MFILELDDEFCNAWIDILNRLALRIDLDAKVLICCWSTCRYALSLKGSAITTHLRVKHQIEHDERDPSATPLPKDGCSEHPNLRVYEGTGWDKTYHGRSRDVLAALAAVSLSRGSGPHLIGRQGTNGLHEDIISTMEDERKIAAVLEALDALLDRCEETARKTSRSILCWLRSTHALAGYPKPFILVYHPSSRRKYRVLFKRCLLLIFRSYRMDPSTRDRLTGIRFKRKQFRFLEAIWNYESVSDLDAQSPRKRLSLPGTEKSTLGGFTQRRLSHNYSEDEREDDDEENLTEGSEEDCEYWSDESQVVRHTGKEEPRGDEQVSEELIELLLGLSLSLCTEQVADGQPMHNKRLNLRFAQPQAAAMASSTTNPPAAPDPFDLGIHTPANLNRGARAALLQNSPAAVNGTIGVSPAGLKATPLNPLAAQVEWVDHNPLNISV
ncbi:hypothetical protein FOXYSP1_20465 [Fusarium oxysporum f. sp. phaseoli]